MDERPQQAARHLGPAVTRVVLNRSSDDREAPAGRWAFLLADIWDADLAVADLRDRSAASLLRDPGTALVTGLPARRGPIARLARIAGPLIGVPGTVAPPTTRRPPEVVCAISAHSAPRPAMSIGVSVATALRAPLHIVMSEAFDERVAIFLPFDQIDCERRHDARLLHEAQSLVPEELPVRCETSVRSLLRTTERAAAARPIAVVATHPQGGPLHRHRVLRLLRAGPAPIFVAT